MIKLNNEQIEILEDVFNYGLNALEMEKEKPATLFIDKNGYFEKFDIDKKMKDIIGLWEVLKKQIEKVD